ncbi:HalOD1 output domain-containing protein [Natronococcus sp.]|uniref:HalOD1 output domain-containing protein n=1 Tax=Natronococcus sp. TaxID=35747 RepID=UPI0025EB3029|nr:HalOD1 output domain-containing protein [Natronococcus sp.]
MNERTTPNTPGCGFGQRVQYDRDDNEPPSIAVATALATYHGEDVTDSSIRLYDYIDPEALDSLFVPTYGSGDRSTGTVVFDVDDVTVTVGPDQVEVTG